MNILVLGKGKTGSLVAEVARERGHQVTAADQRENSGGAALTSDKLRYVDAVIDFTTPAAVIDNLQRVAKAGRNMVVGTTGWYSQLESLRPMVEQSGIGLIYGSNFSVGVNFFFEIARTAAALLAHGYEGRITETHHTQKKDAPSGTAVMLRDVIENTATKKVPIESIREGDVIGIHTLELRSGFDTVTLTHDAHSRRGFAEGAVRAAEWISGKKGLYDFRNVFREMPA